MQHFRCQIAGGLSVDFVNGFEDYLTPSAREKGIKEKHRQVLKDSATSLTIAAGIFIFNFHFREWDMGFEVWGIGCRGMGFGCEVWGCGRRRASVEGSE